jgi:hypothetical protein
MRTIRSLLGLFLGLTILGAIASAVAAAIAKGHLASTGSEADDEFDLVTIYDGLDFRSTAPALRRGSALTWFGGGRLDLRAATLDPAGATLTLRTVFGGLELLVPETWRVELGVMSFLGGAADTRDPDRVFPEGPVLRVSGWAAFGGLGIGSGAQSAAEPGAEWVVDVADTEAAAPAMA